MKKLFKMIGYFVLGFFVFAIGQITYETMAVKIKVNKFIKNAVLNEELSTDEIKYYNVSRETFYPDEFAKEPFFDNDLRQAGTEGDIFVTRQAPFPDVPIVYEFVSLFFGGHAGYIGSDNKVYETYGFPNDDETFWSVLRYGGKYTHVSRTSNYWLHPTYHSEGTPQYTKFGSYYRKEWFGLRVKGADDEDISIASGFINQIYEEEAQYNFLFVLMTKNRYYCTDMMSRAYATIITNDGEQKFNLNQDGFATTVNDLILSNDVYIAYYFKVDRNNVKHIYFLD